MKLFGRIYDIKYSIGELASECIINHEKRMYLRKNMNILVIDDEELNVSQGLKDSNFSIYHKQDIENIKDVEPYEIVLCDIRGVGTRFSEEFGGAFLIKEIKKNYPNKHVIAYTASQYDATYNTYLAKADHVVPKGTSLEDWISILDDEIDKIVNPVHQWKLIREKLLNNGVTTIETARLESEYVRSFKNKDKRPLEKMAIQGADIVKNVMTQVLGSAAVRFFMGGGL